MYVSCIVLCPCPPYRTRVWSLWNKLRDVSDFYYRIRFRFEKLFFCSFPFNRDVYFLWLFIFPKRVFLSVSPNFRRAPHRHGRHFLSVTIKSRIRLSNFESTWTSTSDPLRELKYTERSNFTYQHRDRSGTIHLTFSLPLAVKRPLTSIEIHYLNYIQVHTSGADSDTVASDYLWDKKSTSATSAPSEY